MGKKYLLYGGSGHAKVIADVLRSQGSEAVGIFDDNPNLTELGAIPIVGAYDLAYERDLELIISIGNNGIREKIADMVQHSFGTAIDVSAIVSTLAVIGEGSVVMQGTIIQADAQIGKHCIINSGASVDHDCVIGDFVHVSPHATLCGGVKMGKGSHIGAGATVIQGISIGSNATIGAGAVIIRDIPDNVTVVGNPGRIINY